MTHSTDYGLEKLNGARRALIKAGTLDEIKKIGFRRVQEIYILKYIILNATKRVDYSLQNLMAGLY